MGHKAILRNILQRPLYGSLVLALVHILVNPAERFKPNPSVPFNQWHWHCIQFEFDNTGRLLFLPRERITYEFGECKLSCSGSRESLL
jgi:hypothetical protein